jgi:hypothetical protein
MPASPMQRRGPQRPRLSYSAVTLQAVDGGIPESGTGAAVVVRRNGGMA